MTETFTRRLLGCSDRMRSPLQNDMLITSAPPRRVPEKVCSDNSDAFSCETLPHSKTHTNTECVRVCSYKGVKIPAKEFNKMCHINPEGLISNI